MPELGLDVLACNKASSFGFEFGFLFGMSYARRRIVISKG